MSVNDVRHIIALNPAKTEPIHPLVVEYNMANPIMVMGFKPYSISTAFFSPDNGKKTSLVCVSITMPSYAFSKVLTSLTNVFGAVEANRDATVQFDTLINVSEWYVWEGKHTRIVLYHSGETYGSWRCTELYFESIEGAEKASSMPIVHDTTNGDP